MRLLTIILLAIQITGFGQVDEDSKKQKVKADANEMGKFFLTNDHQKFVDFMFPLAVEKMGGKNAIVKIMTDGQIQMEKDGIRILNVEFGEPSNILAKDKILQCIVPQLITMKVKGGTLKAKASLFAISSDNGASWTFLDVTKKTKEQLNATIPSYHGGHKIPSPTDPVFYRD